MKNLFYLFVLLSFSKLNGQNFGTNSDNLSGNQALGYSLFGLGFTTVAYTYTNYKDMPDASNERTLYYSIGTAMVVTGVLVLVLSPKKKKSRHAWSCITYPASDRNAPMSRQQLQLVVKR